MQKRKVAAVEPTTTPAAAAAKSARRSGAAGSTAATMASTAAAAAAATAGGGAGGSAAAGPAGVRSFSHIAPLIVTTATPRQRNISPHDAVSASSSTAAGSQSFSFGLRDFEKILANVKGGHPVAAAAELALVVGAPGGLKALCDMVKFEKGPASAASLKSVHDALNMSSRARRTVVRALIQEDVAPACVAVLTQPPQQGSPGGGSNRDGNGSGSAGSGRAGDAMDEDDLKSMAAFLLSSVAFQSPDQAARVAGLGAIPPLVTMLSSPSPQQHKAAACTLAELLHDNADGCRIVVAELDGLPKLVKLLASPSDSVRKWSLSVLLKVAHADVPEFSAGIISAGAVPHMVTGLRAKDPRIRETSAELVGQLAENSGARAAELVQQGCLPALLQLLGCDSEDAAAAAGVAAAASRSGAATPQTANAAARTNKNGGAASGAPAGAAASAGGSAPEAAATTAAAAAASSAGVSLASSPPASLDDLNPDVVDAGLFALAQLVRGGGRAALHQTVELGVLRCLLRLATQEDAGVAAAAAKELLFVVQADAEHALLLLNDGGLLTLVAALAQRVGDDEDEDDDNGSGGGGGGGGGSATAPTATTAASSAGGDEEDDEAARERKDRVALVETVLQTLQHLVAHDAQVGVLLISLGGVSAIKPLLRATFSTAASDAAAAAAAPTAAGVLARSLTVQLLPAVQASAAMLHMKWTPPDLRQELLAASVEVLCCIVASHLLHRQHVPVAAAAAAAAAAVAGDAAQPAINARGAVAPVAQPVPRERLFRSAVGALQRLFAPRNSRVARGSHLARLLACMESDDAVAREGAALAVQTLVDTATLLTTSPGGGGGGGGGGSSSDSGTAGKRVIGSNKATAGEAATTASQASSAAAAAVVASVAAGAAAPPRDFAAMQKLYQDDTSSDISIAVTSSTGELVHLKAHRSVLAAYDSAFFKSFTANPNTPDVKIQGIDADVFAAVLKFLYSGEVALTDQNVYGLLLAGIRCDIKVLKERCELYHARQIHTGTVLEYLKLSSEINGEILRRRCLDFSARHIREVAELPAFPASAFRGDVLRHVGADVVRRLQQAAARHCSDGDDGGVAGGTAAAGGGDGTGGSTAAMGAEGGGARK